MTGDARSRSELETIVARFRLVHWVAAAAAAVVAAAIFSAEASRAFYWGTYAPCGFVEGLACAAPGAFARGLIGHWHARALQAAAGSAAAGHWSRRRFLTRFAITDVALTMAAAVVVGVVTLPVMFIAVGVPVVAVVLPVSVPIAVWASGLVEQRAAVVAA